MNKYHKIVASKALVVGILCLSFLFIHQNTQAQTSIPAPVTVTYTTAATLPPCGSNGSGTVYTAATSAPDGGRAAAMNTGGFNYIIPAAATTATTCYYWGFAAASVGGFSAGAATCTTTQFNQASSPTVSGIGTAELIITNTNGAIAFINTSGAPVSRTNFNVRIKVSLSTGTWTQYGTGASAYFLAGPLNAGITATVRVEGLYDGFTNPLLCASQNLGTQGASNWKPALQIYDQINTVNTNQACTSFNPGFFTFTRPTMTSTASKTICHNTSTALPLTATQTSSFAWTAPTLTGTTGGTASSVASGGSLAQTLLTSASSPGTATYSITPSSGIDNATSRGTCVGTAAQTVTITVNPIPTVTATPSNPVICSGTGSGIALTNNTTGGTNSWAWTGTNGTSITGASNSTGTPINQTLTNSSNTQSTATYVITPTFTNAGLGCNGSNLSQTVKVNPTPTVTTTPSNPFICSGFPFSIALSNNTTGGTNSWAWTGTNGTNTTGASSTPGSGTPISHTLTNSSTSNSTATYVITPTFTQDGRACNGSNNTQTVTVYPKPGKPTVNGTTSNFSIAFCGTGNLLVDPLGTNGETARFYATTFPGTPVSSGVSYTVSTPGTYYVTSYNNTTGCESEPVVVTVTITPPFTISNTVSNYGGYGVSCFGGANGSITTTATTTAYPITYTWSTGKVTTISSGTVSDNITGLAAGTYTVFISDAAGCGNNASINITQPTALSLSLVPANFSGYGTSCIGSSTGSITTTPSGGNGAYTYAWTSTPSGFTSASGNISALSARTYNVTVTDGNSCTIIGSSVITDPALITFTYSIGYACSGSTYTSASVTINAAGGASGVYEYRMDAGAWQLSNVFTGLANASNHTFQVRDANNTSCLSATQNFTITFPASGTSVGDCNFIYVTTGGDPSGTLGSKACPVSLAAAFAIYAGNAARNHILMASGAYTFNSQTISVPANIIIDGGYDGTTWIKSTNTATTLTITPLLEANASEGHYTGIILNGNDITLQDLTINVLTAGVSGTTANRGRSIYGVYSNGRTGFLLSRCIINTGAASAGANGAVLTGTGGGGAGGAGGNNGNVYADGCSQTGSNGVAGATGSGTGGGGGGAGGNGCTSGGCNWYDCDAGGCNAAGGSVGGTGGTGAAGVAALANTTGVSTYFIPVDGNNGANGAGGGGGGRGGEGASGTCCTCTCGPTWGTGGAGGRGGNGGLGGNKGYGGGSSFGVYAWGGSGTITDCAITPGTAGSGGTGSNGQGADGGSSGSNGGDNTGYCDGGKGGRGGDGGAGGAGGNASGGAAGISISLQTGNSAAVTRTGTTVPNDGTVTADWKRGCTNSQILLTKTSGSNWTGITSNPSYVFNLTSTTTNYDAADNNIAVYYTSTGFKNISLGTTTLSNFIRIYGARLEAPVNTVIAAISPNQICPTESINLANTISSSSNIIEWKWEITNVSSPTTNVYTSTSASPGTVVPPVGGWIPGATYQVRLQMRELCCGWSIPMYRTFTIFPVLAQPTIIATPSGVVCSGSTIRYSTTVVGATDYTWTVTGGTKVDVSTGVIDVTWPTATTGTVSVVPKDACTPNTDGPVRTINVAVNGSPTVSVSNSNPTICLPGTSLLSASPGSGGGVGLGTFSYIWSPGSTTASSLTVNPTPAGTYTYTVQVTENGSGCRITSPVITVTSYATLSASSATAILASCQLNSTAPYAELSATAAGAGTTGTWSILSGAGTVTAPNSNITQITGLSNSGVATTLNWSVSYNSAPLCTATSSTFTLTPPNLASTLTSVSLQNSGAATSTPRPNYYSCKTCTVRNGNTYIYYDNVGRIIAKIQDLSSPATELAGTEVCTGYDYNAGVSVVTSANVKTVFTSYGDLQPYLPRSWTITPTTNNTNVIVTLYFTAAELNALQTAAIGTDYQFTNPFTELKITKFNGGANGSFTAPPMFPATNPSAVLINPVITFYPNIATGPDYAAEFSISDFSTFYLHPIQFPFAPLPVELVSFTGFNQGVINKLNWVTASEENTLKFEIQKSIVTGVWTTIGETPAAGNSSQQINYDFSDNNPVIGNNYYRLKIIDNDGTFSYSNIINIPINEAVINGIVNVYPNPTNGNLNVEIQSTSSYDTKILVYDVIGKKVFDKENSLVKGLNILQFNFSQLAKGAYILQFADTGGKLYTTKFVKD